MKHIQVTPHRVTFSINRHESIGGIKNPHFSMEKENLPEVGQVCKITLESGKFINDAVFKTKSDWLVGCPVWQCGETYYAGGYQVEKWEKQ